MIVASTFTPPKSEDECTYSKARINPAVVVSLVHNFGSINLTPLCSSEKLTVKSKSGNVLALKPPVKLTI